MIKKYVLITGGSQGLGLETSRFFLKKKYNLIICSKKKSNLKKATKLLENENISNEVISIQCDLSSKKGINKLVKKIDKYKNDLVALVNNAGVYGPFGKIEKINFKEWENCININLIAPIYLISKIIQIFKKNKFGRIVNLSGGGATSPLPEINAYAASKAGLVRASESISLEYDKSFNIKINCVAPGALNTGMLDNVLSDGVGKLDKNFISRMKKIKRSGGTPLLKGAKLIYQLCQKSNKLNGKLISAVWDDYEKLNKNSKIINNQSKLTLQRIV